MRCRPRSVEVARLFDGLEDLPAEMLLDQEQKHVAGGLEGEPEKVFFTSTPFPRTRLMTVDPSAPFSRVACRMGFGVGVVHERYDQLEVHVD